MRPRAITGTAHIADGLTPCYRISHTYCDGRLIDVYKRQDHTFQYCHSEPLNPTISSRGRVSDNLHQLDINIEKRYNQLMDSYVQPQLDAATLEKVKEILTSHGVDRSLLDKIETM